MTYVSNVILEHCSQAYTCTTTKESDQGKTEPWDQGVCRLKQALWPQETVSHHGGNSKDGVGAGEERYRNKKEYSEFILFSII